MTRRATHSIPAFDGHASRRHESVSIRRLNARGAFEALRHRRRLAGIQSIVHFAGFPRSGHSLIGSIIDAHPNARIAHELVAIGLLEAGLPLVAALEALQEQTEDPVFQIVIRDVRLDVSGGTAFSDAVRKFPNAFPNLFVSMVEAGEASGGLASILGKVAGYFEQSVKLTKKVKGAMTYPVAVITLATGLVNVLLVFVIPVFAEMFSSFGSELPKPTQMLIDLSDFLKKWIIVLLFAAFGFYKGLMKVIKTPKGRIGWDRFLYKMPVLGSLIQKIAISRFCRTCVGRVVGRLFPVRLPWP